jgi:hypothetical protein
MALRLPSVRTGREVSERGLPGLQPPADEDQDRRDGEARADLQDRLHAGAGIGRLHLEHTDVVEGAAGAVLQVGLQPVGLGDAHAREALRDVRGHPADLLLRRGGHTPEPLTDAGDRRHHEGRDEPRHQRAPPVDPEQNPDQRGEHGHVPEEHREKPRQRLLDESEVGGEALRQRGGALAGKAGHVGVDQMRVERRLHVGLDAGDEAVGQDRLAPDREALDGGDEDHGQRRIGQRGEVLPFEQVEGLLDHDRVKGVRDRGDADQREDHGDRGAVRPHPFPPEASEQRQGVGGQGFGHGSAACIAAFRGFVTRRPPLPAPS